MSALILCTLLPIASRSMVPILAPIGVVEVVWNKTRDACPQTKPDPVTGLPKLCEQPDSVPIAWHNPLLNQTYLISSTDCTFPGIAPTLGEVKGRHKCDASPYTAAREPAPWTFNNHQWLQSVRVFPNGTGIGLVHNEFHGEQPPHNSSWCSYQRKTPTAQCILWSSDSATTSDGGTTFQLNHAPIITLPRKYIKDAAIAGYGVLGQIQRQNGWYYAHVSRSYNAGTGAGPVGTSARGTCIFRTRDLTDPKSLRGWNGTAWSTEWVNPYLVETPPDELWKRTCADISLDQNGSGNRASHLHVKKFAGPLTKIQGWPTHVMSGLTGGLGKVAYFFPLNKEDDPAPFTAWAPNAAAEHEVVNIKAWLNPCTIGINDIMYPNLLDHDSPFGLSGGITANEDTKADGLSYGLIGNSSLFVYFVLRREYIARIPVAWFLPGQMLPKGPFSQSTIPPPLNPVNCSTLKVVGAGSFDGKYAITAMTNNGRHFYQMDTNHWIYHFKSHWILGRYGQGGHEDFIAPTDVEGQGLGVPKTWGPCTDITVACEDVN